MSIREELTNWARGEFYSDPETNELCEMYQDYIGSEDLVEEIIEAQVYTLERLFHKFSKED